MPYVKAEIDRRKKGDEVKNVWIKVRVSKSEKQAIDLLSDQTGKGISELIREKLLGHK